jgi:hypothetical protein
MRMAFGLVSLLVCVGIIMWLFSMQAGTVSTVNKNVRPQVEQLSGRGEGGMTSIESIKFEPQTEGGKTASLLVTSLVPGGPMEKYFGLKQFDTIVEVERNGMRTKIREFNDPQLAEAQVLEAYQYKGTLVVMRNGQRLTLPATGSAAQPAGQGAAPAPAQPSRDPLQRQLDAIQTIPTH